MNRWITALTLGLLLPVAAAGDGVDTPAPHITVSGHGTARVEPDQAVLRLGIQTQQETAEEAQQQANRLARAVLDGMQELGIAGSNIQTSALNLQPVYSQRRSTEEEFVRRVVAYQADNTIQIVIDELDLVGPAVDRAIAAGANRIQGLTFGLKDDSEAQDEAVRAAVDRAAAKAEAIAAALDRQLGPVLEVQEGGVSVRPVVASRAYAEMAADTRTPVASGQVTVTASVTVVYVLAD